MSFVITGLGNRGEEFNMTRHNIGWLVLDKIWKDYGFGPWTDSAKNKGQVAEGEIGKEKVVLLKPGTMMNGSGKAVATLVRNKKATEKLIVLHDDLDMSLGTFKISYNRGSGGHKGVESIKRAVGTKEFVRIKIGITPTTPSGKLKKPYGKQEVLDFIIGNFKPKELDLLKKVAQDISGAVESIVLDGRELAMTDWN